MTRFAPLLLLLACAHPGTHTTDTDTAVAGPDCTTLALARPAARGEAGGVWDAARGRLVLFGGNVAVPVDCSPGANDLRGDTWAWYRSCDAWVQLSSDGGPSPRGRFATGLLGGRMILHGGRFRVGDSGAYDVYADTWALDLKTDTWTPLPDARGPGKRSNHAGAAVGDRFVIFGGNRSTDGAVFQPLDDAWALDAGGTWTEVPTTPKKPAARLFHAVATDGAHLFVFGGGGADALTGSFFADLWSLDVGAGTWTRLHDGKKGNPPLGRINAHLAYDADHARLVLFGGHDDGALGNTNDVWAFDLAAATWSVLHDGDAPNASPTGVCQFPADFTTVDPSIPERREAGVSAWAGGRLLVSGGESDCGDLDDVWSFGGSDGWREELAATTGESCNRAQEACTSLCD